jgi:hypothetical protein
MRGCRFEFESECIAFPQTGKQVNLKSSLTY